MSTITLTVIAHNGLPADGDLQATFDELGGLIGRADSNQLVLPDPDRSISRVHAQIVFRNGHYAVVDRGSNPIEVNGHQASGNGELPLREGDRLQIGGYELTVRIGAASAPPAADPFADLLGAAPARPALADGQPALPDPLAAFGAPATPSRRAAPAAAAAARAPSAAIPEDWNPFAPQAPAQPLVPTFAAQPSRAGTGAGAAGAPRNLGLDVGAAAPPGLIPEMEGGTESLDALFGLAGSSAGSHDPLAHSALAQAAAQPNMAAHANPMVSLNSAAPASSASQSDAFSDLHRPFIAPTVSVAHALPAAVFSWDSPASDSHTVIQAAPRPAPAAETRRPAPLPPIAFPASAPTAAAAEQAAAIAPPRHALPETADGDALLAAFQAGLNAPQLQLPPLSPELMHLLGTLLREAAGGTVDLLLARATLKREMRADATTIQARENNPLKFSPTAEVALQHLLQPPARGFMAAAPSMRDAYNDLRAHQFGMVAGMRAALEGVLDRFDPASLEGRLTQRSALQKLLPGSRKAQLWDTFVGHFGHIRNEASDDFQALFGKAFVEAYRQHIEQLDRETAP